MDAGLIVGVVRFLIILETGFVEKVHSTNRELAEGVEAFQFDSQNDLIIKTCWIDGWSCACPGSEIY